MGQSRMSQIGHKHTLEFKRWEELKKKCPKLYRYSLHFDCGPGWYDLIANLSIEIEKILNALPATEALPEQEEDELGEIYAEQVKEKYGRLRFYMSYYNKEIDDLIRMAEGDSVKICEVCGAPGGMVNNGSLKVLCDKCYLGTK
jgi:hypothetical protein